MRVESTINNTLTDDLKRLGHICVTYNNLILVWGGYKDSIDKEPEDLWLYNPLSQCWSVKKCQGSIPPGLSGSTSSIIDDKLYVFGGYADSAEGHLNSLYCLDMKTLVWSQIENIHGIEPVPSDKCVSWTYESKLYIFGGYGSPNVEHINQLIDKQPNLHFTRDSTSAWSYRRGWNNQLVEYDPVTNQWNWPTYSGGCPSARAAHAGALMGDIYYIFGGRDHQCRLNDLYSLDMKTKVWSKITTKITPIQQQQLSTIQHSSDNNNIVSSSNSQQDNSETKPQGRSWTSFTPISSDTIVLYGGFSQEETALDDCWLFNIQHETWTRVPLLLSKPRLWHTGVRSPYDEIIIYGGSATTVHSIDIKGTTRLYCDELLTLRLSPKTLVRSALDSVAAVYYNSESINYLPSNLQSLVQDKLKTRRSQGTQ